MSVISLVFHSLALLLNSTLVHFTSRGQVDLVIRICYDFWLFFGCSPDNIAAPPRPSASLTFSIYTGY